MFWMCAMINLLSEVRRPSRVKSIYRGKALHLHDSPQLSRGEGLRRNIVPSCVRIICRALDGAASARGLAELAVRIGPHDD